MATTVTVNLPNDVARCPGNALIERRTLAIYTDPSCEGCHRLIAARSVSAATLYRIREQAQLAAWEAFCSGIPMTWIAP